VETDYQAIVMTWNSKSILRFVGVHILTEMKRITNSFQGFSLVFVHREANKVAH
jgi:hypothetical protein